MKLEEQFKKWYELALKALQVEIEELRGLRPSNVFFLGLGGSGIVGDYIRVLSLNRVNVPIHVVKSLEIPKWIDDKSLVVAISYSGDTLETIRAFEEAAQRTKRLCVVSSGGELIGKAKSLNLPHIELDKGYAPRAALPLMLFSLIKLMDAIGLSIASEDEISESLEILKQYDELAVQANQIANEMANADIPVIIADVRFEPLAFRFKNDLNENAKMLARCEVIPEAMHNDIVGYEGAHKPKIALILSAGDEHIYTKILEEFVKESLESLGVKTLTLKLKGSSQLAKLIHGSYMSGLISIALAKKFGVDPHATISISRYKEKLRELKARYLT